MGYVQTNHPQRSEAEVMSLGWDSLGRIVQTRTLDAVAKHFFDVGLAELCLDALASTQSGALQEIDHE
jgi:hypothetical protein